MKQFVPKYCYVVLSLKDIPKIIAHLTADELHRSFCCYFAILVVKPRAFALSYVSAFFWLVFVFEIRFHFIPLADVELTT